MPGCQGFSPTMTPDQPKRLVWRMPTLIYPQAVDAVYLQVKGYSGGSENTWSSSGPAWLGVNCRMLRDCVAHQPWCRGHVLGGAVSWPRSGTAAGIDASSIL